MSDVTDLMTIEQFDAALVDYVAAVIRCSRGKTKANGEWAGHTRKLVTDAYRALLDDRDRLQESLDLWDANR